MENLKLSLLIIFLSLFSLVGAQTPSLSVKGGLNMSNLYGDDLPDKTMKPGFHIGLGVDFDFTPNMALQTGLFYSTKGVKFKDAFEGDLGGTEIYDVMPMTRSTAAPIAGSDVTVNANYLQLPIHLAYKIDVMPGTKVVLHAGPYAAYGIGGKIKYGSIEIDTFDKDSALKPFDAGVGLGVGAEFGVFLIDLGWDMGLINIARDEGDDGSIKTQNAYLSLGYKF